VKPVRIQRQRTKGWKTPANTVYVGRPTKFGNPWSLDAYWNAGYSGDNTVAAAHCVDMYRAWVTQTKARFDGQVPTAFWNDARKIDQEMPVPDLKELRGKNLMCWCPLDTPCHADVLLELANKD
jgi:hypothetical protein